MTTSHAAHARSRATFGGWRAQRPFWGGLFLILSGLELFISGNLKLALEVHFGPTGFLSYVLPLLMLLCGALSWFTPQQRLFYGILGTVTALYSLIGLNFGGFFLGTVLGLAGGGLAVAWAPDAAIPSATDGDADLPPGPADETYYADTHLDDILAEETVGRPDPPMPPERPSSGMLTDELPTTRLSPLHGGTGAGSAGDQRPPAAGPGELPKRRHLGPTLMTAVLTASIVGATNHTGEAYAAPAVCASSAPAKTATAPAIGGPETGAPATGAPTLGASPSPSPTEEKSGGILGRITDLFGGGSKKEATAEASQSAAAAPSTTGAPPPATSATPSKPAASKPAACASTSPTPNNKKAPNNKEAQPAAGQPFVAKQPSILKTDVMTMDGLTYDGIAELPHKDGTTVKVLAFTMRNSVSTPFQLDTPGAGKLLVTKSSKLTVEGDVKFYTTSFSASVLGLPLTFTPSFPPPPIPLPRSYTACTIELVYVRSNILTAPGMNIAYAA
ncbi:DUF6114 domain-containing protein [Dactylosporangium sp. NPDC000555]|uniref:DUF6114 domain-containing protein n=1 Tax=Dactylosporangium sp. NPDC000555 TaxID=3154260 RepID=UPI00333234B1